MESTQERCTSCHSEAEPLGIEEEDLLMQTVSDWCIINVANIRHLEREFKFDNFNSAIHFAAKVAIIADEADHHPELVVRWGSCTVKWWTHFVNGLQRNDFIMAQETDNIYKQMTGS